MAGIIGCLPRIGRPPYHDRASAPKTRAAGGKAVSMTITRGLSATLLVLLLILAQETAAQPTATIGANPPGSVLYAIGSGLAKVAGDAGTVQLAVPPDSG